MYQKEMADELKKHAGRKWRPTNGAEGEMFMQEYCHRCIQDDPDKDIFCRIISDTMSYEIGDQEYPSEWVIGVDGQPCCMKFKTI